jgi:hypothetical protein
MKIKKPYCLIAIVVGLLLSDPAFAATRTVAFRQDTAPGVPGALFNTFTSAPALNDRGEVAFIATTSGTPTTGVWSEGGGSGLHLVARTGSIAAGTVGLNFQDFRRIVLNNPGQTLVEGVIATNAVGLWLGNDVANLNLLAIEGSHPPGVPAGVTLDKFMGDSFGSLAPSPPLLNDAGQTAYRGKIAGPGINNVTNNDKGLWRGTSAAIAPIVISRDTATGIANGTDFIGFGQPTLNNLGHVAFIGNLAPAGGISGPYVATTTDLNTIASTAGGMFTNLITPPHINDHGDVAFKAVANGNMGIWKKPAGGSLAPVIQGTVNAPGTSSGVTFDHYFGPALNGQGRVAFAALLAGTATSNNNKGIWAQSPSNTLTLVARTGILAPGVDLLFTGLSDVVTFNVRGQVAFTGTAGTSGIWATDGLGILRLIIAGGSTIDVDNGPGIDLRTVSTVAMIAGEQFNGGIGNEDGQASGFNDLGQLAFSATFTDGSRGIFVSDAVAVPEPNALCLFAILIVAYCCRRQTAR